MKSHLVVVASDIHMKNVHAGWETFKQFVKEKRPTLAVLAGDLVDLESLSRYEKTEDTDPYVIEQVQMCAEECNWLEKYCGRVILMPGNHEERWEKAIYGDNRMYLRGAKGLTLKDQMYAQGLSPTIKWIAQDKNVPGVWVGKRALLVRHGHKGASRFGMKHLAAAMLQKAPSTNQIAGHNHRAQLMCHTEMGRVTVAISNPHLSGTHAYNPDYDANWQRGFTCYEFYGRARLRDCTKFTPHRS